MARAIAEGAASVAGVEAEIKRIGEDFPLTKLQEVDSTVLGSPAIYADITQNVRDFLLSVTQYIKIQKKKMKGRKAAIFGSYGYDGAITLESSLRNTLEDIGYKVQKEACFETDSELKYFSEKALDRCRAFGKKIAAPLV